MTTSCQTVTVAAPGTISGTVKDEGTLVAIVGATITLKLGGTTLATTTSTSAGYSFTGLAAGTYEVDASMTAYVTYTNTTVTVTAGTTTTLNIVMYTLAFITATNMTVTPLSCVAPCTTTVLVAWANQGETVGSFIPNITVDGVAQTPGSSQTLNPGGTVSLQWTVTLSAGTHSICPTPN